jgi:hypothetical protein
VFAGPENDQSERSRISMDLNLEACVLEVEVALEAALDITADHALAA